MITETAGASSADIFATYHARIRSYILGMVHDLAEADDLTQDVFVQVHRKLGSLRHQDALVSWLYRIATHVCYDRFLKSSRQPRIESLDDGEAISTCSESEDSDVVRLDRVLERKEMSACVRKYIEELRPEYRQVIVLHDLEELTNPEIAEMLGVSLDTVKIRLHRARRKLEEVLSAGCDFSCDERGVVVCEPVSRPQRLELKMYPSAPPRLRKAEIRE
jgi:RNA polymerase sigma-70 factor (ECF subfamily)